MIWWLLPILCQSCPQPESDAPLWPPSGERPERYWSVKQLQPVISVIPSVPAQVVIELGNRAGYSIINEARDLLLSVSVQLLRTGAYSW